MDFFRRIIAFALFEGLPLYPSKERQQVKVCVRVDMFSDKALPCLKITHAKVFLPL